MKPPPSCAEELTARINCPPLCRDVTSLRALQLPQLLSSFLSKLIGIRRTRAIFRVTGEAGITWHSSRHFACRYLIETMGGGVGCSTWMTMAGWIFSC